MSYFFLCWAWELFADSRGKVHNECGLTMRDIAFFKDDVQLLTPGLWRCVDRVQVLLWTSKSDHTRVGAVNSRVKRQWSCHRSIGIGVGARVAPRVWLGLGFEDMLE